MGPFLRALFFAAPSYHTLSPRKGFEIPPAGLITVQFRQTLPEHVEDPIHSRVHAVPPGLNLGGLPPKIRGHLFFFFWGGGGGGGGGMGILVKGGFYAGGEGLPP